VLADDAWGTAAAVGVVIKWGVAVVEPTADVVIPRSAGVALGIVWYWCRVWSGPTAAPICSTTDGVEYTRDVRQ